jgi:hypothetical protein
MVNQFPEKFRQMLERIAIISRELRRRAHGDYVDARHLSDYVALLSRVTFLAAVSAIILKNAHSTWDKILYYPLSLGMVFLVIHLMLHIYWMTYDYISSWMGDAKSNSMESVLFGLTLLVTIFAVFGVTRLYVEILENTINIGAWITTHDQP